MGADIVEIYWNARPHLERMGVSLRRGEINAHGQSLLEEVRKALVAEFPGTPVLVRIAVRTGDLSSDVRVLRQGVEQSDCVGRLRTVIDQALQRTQPRVA